MALYESGDAGCWADGTLGHEHIRSALRGLTTAVVQLMRARGQSCPSELAEARDMLAGPMSDDAWEEEIALEYANDYLCSPGTHFELDGGDLMLLSWGREDDGEWL